MNLTEWKNLVLTAHPNAQFTLETGAGETYGDEGDWTAHTGPDMQADVVGVFVPGEVCTLCVGDAVHEYTAE